MKIEDTSSLIDRVLEIANSERNQKLKKSNPQVSVMVGIGRSLLAKKFEYSMIDYYQDSRLRLNAHLISKIFLHETFEDDTVVEPAVGYDYGAAGTLEAQLFGVPPVFEKYKDPFVSVNPVMASIDEYENLESPDFYKTEPMPLIHQKYSEIVDLVRGKIDVTFPGWVRGPWSISCFLRGFENIYMDIIDFPEKVHDFQLFLADCRILWEKQRSAFLGMAPDNENNMFTNCYDDYRRVHVSDIYNDEVDGNMISPAVYRDVIFPAEKKLAAFYNGINYYHSCGNLTPFLETLSELSGLRILHISSWTDLKKANELTDPDVVLQKVVHPEDDVLHASEEKIRQQIKQTLKNASGRKLWICADAIYKGNLEKVKNWLNIVKDEVDKSGINNK